MRRFTLHLVWVLTLALTTSYASAVPLYLVSENLNSTDDLIRYENGVATTVGNIGFREVRGLAYDATTDTLFGLSRQANQLISIDQNTGVGMAVSANNFLTPAGNMNELSVDAAGNLFAVGSVPGGQLDTLFSVDKNTGIGTAIGPFGPGFTPAGLAFDHSTGSLYGSEFLGQFFNIDPNTGAATNLGNISSSRIAFDQSTGTLWGASSLNNVQLVTIDLNTLAATPVDVINVPTQIYALDFGPAGDDNGGATIPEPATATLAMLGLACVLRRRRAA